MKKMSLHNNDKNDDNEELDEHGEEIGIDLATENGFYAANS